jgi:hypothetical protein
MNVPNWWETTLLALAAFRTWKLLAEDDILDRPRRYVTRLGPKWKKEGDPIPKAYRAKLAEFLSCPYCFGAWIGLVWWGLWEAWPHGVLVAAVPFAISAVIVLVAKAAD